VDAEPDEALGYVKGDVNYKRSLKGCSLTDAKKQMKALDMPVPDGAYPKFTVMGGLRS